MRPNDAVIYSNVKNLFNRLDGNGLQKQRKLYERLLKKEPSDWVKNAYERGLKAVNELIEERRLEELKQLPNLKKELYGDFEAN